MQHSFASAGSAAAGFMVALALVSCGASGAHRTPDDGVKALIAGASSYGLPEFPEQGRLRVPGDARCVLRRMQTAMVGGKPHTLVGVYAAFDAHCSDGAVFLAVYATPSPDEQGFAADRLIEVSGAATDFGSPRLSQCANDCGPGSRDFERDADRFLAQLVAIQPVLAHRLPAWPHSALQPSADREITFEPRVDRETFETVRALDGLVLCWTPGANELRCVANAPGRRAGQLDLFSAYGFGEEGIKALSTLVNR